MRDARYNAMRALLCNGTAPHVCDVPNIKGGYGGVTGSVECAECGASMSLVDIITVERNPSWGLLSTRAAQQGGFYYTAGVIRGILRAGATKEETTDA